MKRGQSQFHTNCPLFLKKYYLYTALSSQIAKIKIINTLTNLCFQIWIRTGWALNQWLHC